MYRKTVSGILIVLIATCLIALTTNIHLAKTEPATITVPTDVPTIQAAIDGADPGDTIYVMAGTYYENVYVWKSLNLVGEDQSNTTIDGSGIGDVVVIDANDVNISDFTIRYSTPCNGGDPYAGLYLIYSDNCRVIRNNITANCVGVYLLVSNNNTFVDNIFSHSARSGIYLWESMCNNITANTIFSNGWGIVLSLYSHNTTVIGNDVYSNLYTGIQVGMNADHNTVMDNTVTDNDQGITVAVSHNNVVSSNNAFLNKYIGLILDASGNSTFHNNTLSANTQAGIYLNNAHGNLFTNNNISDNGSGIATSAGIYVEDSGENTFYHNNIIGNLLTQVDSTNSINTWDCGYPSGGNYWSDYSGTDSFYGVGQNINGSDGIGDIPRVIDGSNQDDYPLVNPWPNDHMRIHWTPTSLYPVPSSVPRQGEPVLVTASVIVDSNETNSVILSYRVDEGEWWNTTMEYTQPCNLWACTIPGQSGNTTVEFYIYSYDHVGNIIPSSVYSYEVLSLFESDVNGDGKVRVDDILKVATDFGLG